MQLNVATYSSAQTITKSDTADQQGRALYVGGPGDVAMVMDSGDVVVFNAVPVGAILPCGFRRINSTNTTATLMIALQ